MSLSRSKAGGNYTEGDLHHIIRLRALTQNVIKIWTQAYNIILTRLEPWLPRLRICLKSHSQKIMWKKTKAVSFPVLLKFSTQLVIFLAL